MSNAKSLVKAFTATVGLILVVGIITASAQTSQFVSMGRAGIVLASTATMGWTDAFFCRGAANVIGLGGCTASFPAMKRSTTTLQVRLADDSGFAPLLASIVTFSDRINGNTNNALILGTAPTISSGFGTSPSIVSNNATATFRVNVGTGGVATSGIVALPAAATGWNCIVSDMTNNTVTRQTASTTTTVTVTAAAAWAASDVLNFVCFGF
jgi:hypothetical protein